MMAPTPHALFKGRQRAFMGLTGYSPDAANGMGRRETRSIDV
jgi:hypothetical protein